MSDPTISRPSDGEIADLAYRLWEERGCPIGSPDDDWLLAEQELIHQKTSVVAA